MHHTKLSGDSSRQYPIYRINCQGLLFNRGVIQPENPMECVNERKAKRARPFRAPTESDETVRASLPTEEARGEDATNNRPTRDDREIRRNGKVGRAVDHRLAH